MKKIFTLILTVSTIAAAYGAYSWHNGTSKSPDPSSVWLCSSSGNWTKAKYIWLDHKVTLWKYEVAYTQCCTIDNYPDPDNWVFSDNFFIQNWWSTATPYTYCQDTLAQDGSSNMSAGLANYYND